MKESKELVRIARDLIGATPRDKSLKEFIRGNQFQIENGIEKWVEYILESATNAYVDVNDYDTETEDVSEGPYSVGYAEVVVDADYEVEGEPNVIDIDKLSEIVIEHLSNRSDELWYAAEINDLYEKDKIAYEKYVNDMFDELATDRLFARFILSLVPRIFSRRATSVDDIIVKYSGKSLSEVSIEPTLKGDKILWTVKDEEKLMDILTDEFCEDFHRTGWVPSSMSGD